MQLQGTRLPKRGGGEGCCGRTQLGRTYASLHRLPTRRGGCHRRAVTSQGGTVGGNAKCTCKTQFILLSARNTLRTLNRGKICAPCMIRGACAAKGAPSWQDLRAMHSQKAICGAFRIHGAHILPKPAHFGCMARESCRELVIFPSEAPSGMHGAKRLPRIAAWERTTAKSCHGLPPGNASRENIATASRPRAHCRHALLCSSLRRMHRGRMLPCPTARGRTAAASCQLSRTSSCEKVQDARSRHVSPEPIRGMRRHRRPRACAVARWSRRRQATPATGLAALRGH